MWLKQLQQTNDPERQLSFLTFNSFMNYWQDPTQTLSEFHPQTHSFRHKYNLVLMVKEFSKKQDMFSYNWILHWSCNYNKLSLNEMFVFDENSESRPFSASKTSMAFTSGNYSFCIWRDYGIIMTKHLVVATNIHHHDLAGFIAATNLEIQIKSFLIMLTCIP